MQAQHHRPTRLCGRLASCQWPLRSVGAIIRSDWTGLPINSVDAYSNCISSDRISPMPIFKYFLCVGSLLSVLLFAWGTYLEPPTSKAQATPPTERLPEAFRPTPAPAIVEAEQRSAEETAEPSIRNPRSHHVSKVTPTKKKQRTQMARPRTAPDRSFAYFPASPFFFGWR